MSDGYKIVFIGAPGSGKTTCIASISDIDPVSTDVPCTESMLAEKDTTTVAIDYGELQLDGDVGKLLLYGLPGQPRFSYMFDVVRFGLFGAILLVDGSSDEAIRGLSESLEGCRNELKDIPVVLAINKSDTATPELKQRCQDVLGANELMAPVMVVDARRREDVVRVFEVLLTLFEFGFDHLKSEGQT
jgi:signal recognition particle receptor subunit beta